MRRLAGVFDAAISFASLLAAYRRARRGHRRSAQVLAFALELERELLALRTQLGDGSYRPGAYRQFVVYERKPRLISAAPFRDRVVHHAAMAAIEPALDRRFIAHSYACRRGRGTHAAVERYQQWARRYRYVLKLDVAAYFPSIDHEILKAKLARRIGDRRMLALLGVIIDASPPSPPPAPCLRPGDDLLSVLERRCGIPVGNLTSQFFANLYLDDLDHFIVQTLHAPAYLRYVDDMVLLSDSKAFLHDAVATIRERLALERLSLHPRKVMLTPTRAGIELLGYRVYPHFRRLAAHNGKRFARRLARLALAYREGRCALEDVTISLRSWIAHASHADTAGLREAIVSGTVFRRA